MTKKNECCSAPFNQLFIQSSGKVFPCAFLQNHTLLGNVKEQTIEEIWNGEKMAEFRRLHREGNYPKCHYNQNLYVCHKFLPDHPDKELDTTLNIPPRLDFMIDSYCNLKCTMCTNVLEERGGFDDPEFWVNFEESVLPNLKEIEIIGGEPLILKSTLNTLNLIKKVNPEIKVKITTNGHYKLETPLKNALKDINFVNFAYSIDSLKPEVFGSIRQGGDLNLVLKTLDDYLKFNMSLNKKIPIEVNVVVQQENAYEIPSLLQFIRSKGLGVYLALLVYPDDNALTILEGDEQLDIFNFYLDDFKTSRDPELMRLMLKFIKQMGPENRLKANTNLAKFREQKATG